MPNRGLAAPQGDMYLAVERTSPADLQKPRPRNHGRDLAGFQGLGRGPQAQPLHDRHRPGRAPQGRRRCRIELFSVRGLRLGTSENLRRKSFVRVHPRRHGHQPPSRPRWRRRSPVVSPSHRAPQALARRFRAADAHPDIVGVLPVTFYVRDAQLAAQTNLPLHRPRPRVRARRALDERTKTALQSLVGLCTGAINTGTVFRIPADANQVVPDLGRLVLRGKGWKWTPSAPLPQTTNVAVEFFSLREFERAPVPPLDSFTAYHRLWPYHSLRIDASRSS
ncbi:hypothetical protein LXA43DRAFT_427624 [Ganoderma leucocontextum]|nr:hypothetical protein LXA43DRAFT_427624 [Ganoderma leucocontextum]